MFISRTKRDGFGLIRRASRLTIVMLLASFVLAMAGPLYAEGTKKIVFIAGRRSHGYGSHEHKAGCLLLAKALNENVKGVKAIVYADGWPKDAAVLDDAAVVVMYGDGGGQHMVNAHLEQVNALAKKGVGLVCIHYAVEVPKGKSGDYFVDWIGGYFEAFWSVNPHWTAEFKDFPNHPTTRGVKPFAINDEWYYHMRFRKDMKGVSPILTAIPPDSTRKRKDGPHSNNPTVRSRLGLSEHVAWACERPDGGRGFGFTGGHFHWNWGNDQFRKLMLNAIVWSAKLDVPQDGVTSKSLTVEDLKANQDYGPPKKFSDERIQKMLDGWAKSDK